MAAASMGARGASINFSTFVTSPDIAAAEGGNTQTIAFNYAGNKFVGTVRFSNQLYSTNLSRWQRHTFLRTFRSPRVRLVKL